MKRVFLLAAGLLAWPALVWGHASLVSPAPDAVLEHAPKAVVLTFNEPVGVTVIRLFDPRGQQLPTASIKGRHRELRIPVPPDDKQRTYLLSWRIVSADGHPTNGSGPARASNRLCSPAKLNRVIIRTRPARRPAPTPRWSKPIITACSLTSIT